MINKIKYNNSNTNRDIELSNLLKKWKRQEHHKNELFIYDGIIDTQRWSKSQPKILFILKEAWEEQYKKEDWDLCKIIRTVWKGPKYKIWRTLAYWAYAIQYSGNRLTPPLPDQDDKKYIESFLSCAIINIKKSGGKSSSDFNDLASYVQKDKKLLKRQIELISPDIIVCGSTFDLVKDLFADIADTDYDLLYRWGNIPIINFGHPANRYPHKLNYYTLAFILNIIKSSFNIYR